LAGPNSRSTTAWLTEGTADIFSAFLVRVTNFLRSSAVSFFPSLISLKQAQISSLLVAISSNLRMTGSFLGEAGLGALYSKVLAARLSPPKGFEVALNSGVAAKLWV
jgi:hypothetical protein